MRFCCCKVSDAFKVSLAAQQQEAMMGYHHSSHIDQYYFDSKSTYSPVSFFDDTAAGNCSGSSTIDFSTIDIDYKSLQYSMMITTVLEVLGAFFFFANAWYIF